MSDNAGNPFEGAPIIFAYTRAMAIADGVLVELKQAQWLGFRLQVVCTERVWQTLVDWPHEGNWQDTQMLREQDLLRAAYLAAQAKKGMAAAGVPDPQPDRLDFYVRAVPAGETEWKEVQLYMLIHPGDTPEPVATVMFPDED